MTDVAQNAVRQYETRKRSRTTPDARALRTTPEARAVRTTPEARAVRKTPEARARRVVRRLTFQERRRQRTHLAFRSQDGERLDPDRPDLCAKIGHMDIVCQYCTALRWSGESEQICCNKGNVQLPLLADPPSPLKSLLADPTPVARSFRKHIRAYNSALCMASSAAKTEYFDSGIQQFRINGQVAHRMGGLLPPEGMAPRYSQLFVLDNDGHLNHLMNSPLHETLNKTILASLMTMLRRCNPYAHSVQRAARLDAPTVRLVLDDGDVADRRTYNKPRVSEFAAFLPETNEPGSHREIIIRMAGGRLQYINECNPAYDPLYFVLLFPEGEHGWEVGIPHARVRPRTAGGNVVHDERRDDQVVKERNKVTVLQFAKFYMMQRVNDFNRLQRARKLYEE